MVKIFLHGFEIPLKDLINIAKQGGQVLINVINGERCINCLGKMAVNSSHNKIQCLKCNDNDSNT
jgi:hypothetical protein